MTSPTVAPPAIESDPKLRLPVVQPDGTTSPADVLPTATDDTSTTGTDGSSTTSTTVVIVVVVALLGAVALLVSFGVCYLSRRQRTKATDFNLEIQKMLEINEIDEATVDKAAIPVEIPRRNVNVITKIGSGQFGDVCKATHTDPSGAEFLVAVKTVRDTAVSVEATNEMKLEATVMAQVGSHPNLVSLVGVVTRGDPLLLVLSYCELGSLLSVLKAAARSGRPVELTEKIDFAVGTAAGMELARVTVVDERHTTVLDELVQVGYVPPLDARVRACACACRSIPLRANACSYSCIIALPAPRP